MTKPSKGAAVFFFLFGLPFFMAGLAVISAQFSGSPKFGGNPIFGVVFGSVFALIGGGFICAAIGGYGLLKKQSAIEEANPHSPWLWRADWANRRAESLNKKSEATAWVLCIFVNLILIPMIGVAVPKLARDHDPRMFLPLAFGLIGLVLFVNAVRASLRRMRFGKTYFELNALPFYLGDHLSGRINLNLETQTAHGIDLRLSCVRRIITGSGKSTTTNEAILWQADQNILSGAVGPGPFGRAIPVDFALPPGGFGTNHDNPSDQILWLLHAQADVPGVDYSDDFELPVFTNAPAPAATEDSQAFSSAAVGSFRGQELQVVAGESGAVSQPAQAKVIVSTRDGGTEFYFPPFRNPSRSLVLLVFTLIWTGAIYFMYHAHAPLFFPIIFALFDLILIYGAFHTILGSARIGVADRQILWRSGILGLAFTQRIPATDVVSIVSVMSMQQGGHSTPLYAIRLRVKDGRKITLADEIDSRQEARWVVGQIETLLGLRLDTHVEIDLPLGVPPLQPGGQAFTNPSRRQSTAASLAVFLLVALAVFGWVFRQSSANPSRVRGSRTAAAPRTNPLAHRVFSGPMTEADVERVFALPAQDQAEELLERAIGHDERALELFDQHVESWIGHIRTTSRMKQLEQRSQYSKDLRVRYANADINLALDGWQKNEHAADLLIERAHTDPNYRAASVYFLGMLAGRGVDYDRIHGVLLEYARNDKDAAVRQWAVEGMRYLGKDAALDELFVSFTEDPSPTVQERAGCNISDCGNFMRKQRMRMAPKLIDLVLNSQTTSQMRKWCFLALREITDENLPADGLAWSRWYQEHGSEKMVEFERLDWWQVRGDE
jgi:hypothetical protein